MYSHKVSDPEHILCHEYGNDALHNWKRKEKWLLCRFNQTKYIGI